MKLSYNKIFNIIQKNKVKSALILLAILFLYSFIFSDYGLMERFSLEIKLKETKKEVKENKKTSDSLKKIIFKLKTDSLEIERIAREQYGMIKDGEEIFYIKTNKIDTNKNKE